MQILWTKEKISDLGKENGESYLGLDMRENSQWHEQMAISKTSIFYISQKGIEMLDETFFILFKYFFLKESACLAMFGVWYEFQDTLSDVPINLWKNE